MELQFDFNVRFVCVCNPEVLLLLEVEVRGHEVQQVLSHQFGLQGDRNISTDLCTVLFISYNLTCV